LAWEHDRSSSKRSANRSRPSVRQLAANPVRWPVAGRRVRMPDRRPVDIVDRPRQRTADSLFRVRDGAGEAAVHVEIEGAGRTDIPGRLFEYASAAVVATRLPVWSVVVLLRPGGRPPGGTGIYRIPGVGGDAFVFRYHVVPLWRLD